MDNTNSIRDRINTLRTYNQGIKTILFMSPIFPYITDFKAIIKQLRTMLMNIGLKI